MKQWYTNSIWLFLLGCVAVVQSRSYNVIILTGYYETSAPVDIRFVGDGGTSSSRVLVPSGKTFKRNSKYVFKVSTDDVGRLTAVEVYLHSGSSSRWSIDKVLVMSNGMYTFIYGFNNIIPGTWTTIKGRCPRGTKMKSDGSCVDIDECQSDPCQGPQATCHNKVGSFECRCGKGYRLRYGRKCEDINECLVPHECEEYCHNTPGSYKCGCRSDGYRVVDGTKCVDINECQEKRHNCDKESTYCSNVKGSFYCYCNPGYERVNSTHCKVRYCEDLSHYSNKKATVVPSRCLTDKGSRYLDKCTIQCKYGYEIKEPSLVKVTCGKHGYWEGGFSYCRGVKCPPVTPNSNAVIYPSTCLTEGGRHDSGSNCNQYCRNGYQNIGASTPLVCQANGTWSGLPAICKKIHPNPTISCPLWLFVVLPPGKNTTSLGSKWKLPTSNMKNLAVSPSWANQFYEFPYGETTIKWTATNQDGKTANCYFKVTVRDTEAPKVKFCPGPKVFKAAYTSKVFVEFKRPTFTDNVGVVKVTPEYKGGVQKPLGSGWNQYFEASDKAGNRVTCHFVIIVGGSKCSLAPDEKGGWLITHIGRTSILALRSCPNNTMNYGTYNFYQCDDSIGTWRPPKVADCVPYVVANITTKCRQGFGRSPLKYQSGYCVACPLGHHYQNVGGNDTCVECPAGTYQDQRASTSCKTCPSGTSSLQGEHVCRDVCKRGTFSKDGIRPFCSLCLQRRYQPKERQTSCLVCPNDKFTNTKLGSFSCGDVKPPASSQDLLVIERIVKPDMLNTSSSQVANVFECFIKNNNYDRVSVQWEVLGNGIPADFLGSMYHQEINNQAGKPVGARLTITRTSSYNADVKYACNAVNQNGKTQTIVTVKSD